MKRVISVHLAGRIFQIEEDGYDALNGLSANQRPRNEVEKQLADHFERKLTGSKIVITLTDVLEVCSRLGFSLSDTRPVKKLYRQPENRIIAGVCAGLGDYFDIDPVVVRIVFVVSFFFTLTMGFWVYIVMWIVTPKYERRKLL
ncbi:MAG: PspC domain-containing protein [Prevotellaceae bacterium]|jgi:phage shock protein PspC (stress-responsive transcriptional regulator)|nr:PspC domain-containing protein [Prevotellaceae bacterium]